MHKRTTPKVFGKAKKLHRNMTPAEIKLWAHLRAHRMKDVHFRNQHAIGNYIVDFSPKGTMCAPRRRLIIELDGSQHLEQEEYDAERTAFWESKGYRVLCFWNNQAMNCL
jgi:very-short-patch-repair endonuclease